MTEPANRTTEDVETDSTALDDAPVLPPELLLIVIERVHWASRNGFFLDRSTWQKTLARMLRVSRACYELSLPVLLRDLYFDRYCFKSSNQLAAFLDDGIGMDKFRAVRKLELELSRGPEFYRLFAKLLGEVGPSLQELTVSVDDIPPSDLWDSFKELPRLRKLRLETKPITRSEDEIPFEEYDAVALPYNGLLAFVDQMGHLENFELDVFEVTFSRCERLAGLKPWAEELSCFPNLRTKLSYVSLDDGDVSEWADFPPPNVKHCHLESWEGSFDYWKKTDVFLGLEELTIFYGDTGELFDWPLRSLKELTIEEASFTLDEEDFPAVRRRIEGHNLKVTIHLCNDRSLTRREEPEMRAELHFWKTVSNTTVSGFELLNFDCD